MDFALNDIQRRIRDAARAFAEAELVPRAAEFEADEAVPPDVFRALGERGLMAVGVPEALGGSGAGTVAYSLAMSEVARACASTAVTMAVTNMVGEVIAAFGDDAQKAEWCPRLAAGELGGFALSEVGAGSDPGGMRTRAVLEGDEWVIDGTKQWISHGDTASVLVVWARTEDAPGPRGLSCFLVEKGTPGLGVAKHEDKMGLRASHTVGLELDGVRVPKANLLGERGSGFRIAMMALDGGRIGIASQALGIGTAALEAARAHAATEGDRDQAVQWRLADMATRLAAARQLALRAAFLKQAGEPFSREASMAKAFSTEGAWEVCNQAAEVVGDAALERGHVIDRALRDVRVSMIYEGTSEVQRVVIARHVLGR
ncbi:MAG TPA: acyl-CoA dehydrogenase family protein [Polyangiaceae bacterium LLY-WYZ-15_(1-7)]|nr:acyl-CoA dehydrogenase [Myxococcales bacterium]MAT29246.1 acyl-CoA dehydrogenase [Sandaracinus sp.]HJL01252.1 acyl-CoA dehydrogenase family protein [Polyangiaceae bacterium LLY-WYZ-15_(1-7)]MBJ74457.1 acyl-CoA dehydrogenase [Sandaracinus sp.]HJL09090.1 acyl-CoA dehydrogenase family protein [Polyangiaceae bacterium LLY-WYZ-15_(1-7)]